MTTELKTLFEFQRLITDMQQVILDAKRRGTNQTMIEQMTERVDKLIEIYKAFDGFYYQAHYAQQKILFLESDNLKLAKQITELKTENEKITAAIKWN